MANLDFTKEGNSWVSPALEGDDDYCIAFQFGFNTDSAKLEVEFTLDESIGWSNKAVILCPRLPKTYGDIVTGVKPGIKVRFKTNRKPDVAIINE